MIFFFFFYRGSNRISIFHSTGHSRMRENGRRLWCIRLAWRASRRIYCEHIVNNAARKPISLPAACHWRRNNDHSHFLLGFRWQIALCCKSGINWPIDLYRPLLCLEFHFYVPRTCSRRRYFAFLYRASTPLVDGVHDKSTEHVADCYRLWRDDTYIYVLIADVNSHPLEWRTGRKLFWFDKATIWFYQIYPINDTYI